MKNLLKALGKAQAVMPMVRKDGSNPFHKTKYATLSETWNACKEDLAKCGLVLTHEIKVGTVHEATGATADDILVTHVWHVESGEHLDTEHRLLCKDRSPQAYGSAITYARRYSLQLLLAMVTGDEDDDGENAQSTYRKNKPAPPPPQAPAPAKSHNFGLHLELAQDVCKRHDLSVWKTWTPARQGSVTGAFRKWYANADKDSEVDHSILQFWQKVDDLLTENGIGEVKKLEACLDTFF